MNRNLCLIALATGLLGSLHRGTAAPVAGVKLHPIATYSTGQFDRGGAEIVAYDPVNQRVFSLNADAVTVDVLNIANPRQPTLAATIDLSAEGSVATSVAFQNGRVAVAVAALEGTDPGRVFFFDNNLNLEGAVTVGALPDMVTFAPNGLVLAANEGEPSQDYTIDPEGTVSIIDLSGGVGGATVTTVEFTAFNGQALDPSVRIFGPNATVAQDLEPEYITVSADSTTAWVSLQENNALARIDLSPLYQTPAGAPTVELIGLGFKNHALPGYGLDASDRDDVINITSWPVFGMYQPDALAKFTVGGQTYLILANEGDGREYDAFEEEARVRSLTLDPTAFPNASALRDNAALGRLNVSIASGDTDGDGDFDELYAFGGRSFSIRDANGNLVFDSGDQLEQIIAAVSPRYFNANNDDNSFDNRSDNKGPEPEGVTTGMAHGRLYGFIALERIGGIVVYDLTNPTQPELVEYANNRKFQFDPEDARARDLGAEGIVFIGAAQSPIGIPLLVTGNEVSGTVTIFEIRLRD
jgi:hypothetical protein